MWQKCDKPRFIFLKKTQWSESTGPWTEGAGAGPWSMVDRSPYRFTRSNQGHQILIRQPRVNKQGRRWSKVVRLGRAVAESPARRRNDPLVADGLPRMVYKGEKMMAIPFLGKAEHERVGAELAMKRGRR
jgi:hypothetical protein